MTSVSPVKLAFNYIEPEGCLKDKTPLIFLHGVISCKEFWDDIPQIAADATKRKTYVLDSRNHGDSPWTDVFNFDYNVDDLLHFMDTIRAPTAILIGHSMGGVTAMKTALIAPQRIEKMVAEDISARPLSKELLDMIAMMAGLIFNSEQRIPPEMDEESATKFIHEDVYKHYPKELMDKNTITKPETRKALIYLRRKPAGGYECKANVKLIHESLKNPDIMSDFFGVFDKPSLFIYGALSPFLVGADEENIRNFFPNAELVGIEDATHTVHTDQPKTFMETLLSFLDKK